MTENKPNTGEEKPAPAIDKLIHEPARFNIMAHLYVVESADFLFLMRQTGLTKGNLSSHMSKLEMAGYVEVEKEFVHKKPHTMLSLSNDGRKAFQDYRESMMRMLDDLPK
ncbi:MAG: transcriptional regulator [Phycisphaeraceae bacterium]|nr:transcriptional regulator [Phycisphaeraceae bacterium]